MESALGDVGIDEQPARRGLTTAEVEERRAAGKVNHIPDRTSRTYLGIVRSNVFTRFNALISALAVVILVVGELVDALFAGVMLLNTAIGIVQESRAKRTLDRLRVLIAPTIGVVRDGAEESVDPEELVVDDLVVLRSGDQVPVDAVVVVSRALEVDESALTGEADPIAKRPGDEVRSGSAVVAGSADAVATHVGSDAWIHRLVEEAKEFVLTTSEIRTGVDRLLQAVGWIIGPLAALLLWSQLRSGDDVNDSLVSAVAGVVGLVPQGLVLLVSMAMAVAIVRLARHHVVVQELHAVEGLARIDVLCVDKTGTLTTGRFRFEEIIPLGLDLAEARDAIGAYVASEATPTSSTRVLAEELPAPSGWDAAEHVAFSSARKWSATTFVGRGTWVLGAPETVLDTMPVSRRGAAPEIVAGLASDAKRLLLAAHTDEQLGDDGELPGGLRPAALVVLSEELRGDAAEILGFFARQHVDVKIISGDSEATVSAVARRLGIDGADRSVDLRHVEPDDLARVTDEATVFGRVLPEQKREIVGALQSAGHTVAMTGDGVNDIPALKSADTGIAMDTATPATKSVAQLVLLDGRFDRLPHVVGEGRRVVANMERVSSLFVTKTVYATIVALFIGVSGSVFPFLPRHLSLVSELTIGIPAFLLSFRAADRPTRPGYLRRVLRFAIPAGIVAATVTLVAYWLIRAEPIHAAQAEARTASTLALVSIALWILYRLMRPLDRYEGLLLGALIAAFLAIIGAGPTREFYALDWPPWFGVGLVAGVVFGSIVLLETLLRWVRPQEWAWLERLVGDLDGSLDDADAESGIAGAAVGDRIDAAATGDPS